MKQRKLSNSRSDILKCTACWNDSDAELLHPVLNVPICGACNVALENADLAVVDNQSSSCTWCGGGDGNELYMCDTCVRCFCTDCVTRNFGASESHRVRALKVWQCYICSPTADMLKIRADENKISLLNIDKAYAAVRPPALSSIDTACLTIVDSLQEGELKFASLFSGIVANKPFHDMDIVGSYLTAVDLFPTVFQLSKRLKEFFLSKVQVIPGLFRTEFGEENQCRLFDHQLVALNCMYSIENRLFIANGHVDKMQQQQQQQQEEFGALRGGIFGDEPGLGKTVTALALIAATARTRPHQPAVFWECANIDEHWAALRGQYGRLLTPVILKLQRMPCAGRFGLPRLHEITRNIDLHCTSIRTFEGAGRNEPLW